MANDILEIAKLSRDGSVKRKVVCLSGRVNILQSQIEMNLTQYQRALFGESTVQRYSILLDKSDFDVAKHNVLSIDAASLRGVKCTVREYLLSAGAEQALIENLLIGCGLGSSVESSCELLAPRQALSLQILCSCFEPDKVLILSEPFKGLTQDACDRLGEEIVDFGSKRKGLVVITSLEVSPDSWTANAQIQRIQLDRQRLTTYGVPVITSKDLQQAKELHTSDNSDANLINRDPSDKPPKK